MATTAKQSNGSQVFGHGNGAPVQPEVKKPCLDLNYCLPQLWVQVIVADAKLFKICVRVCMCMYTYVFIYI